MAPAPGFRARKTHEGGKTVTEKMITKTLDAAPLDSEPGARRIRHLVSSPAPDREGDVVELAGWRFQGFLRNPVVLFGHRHDRPPIARCAGLRRTPHGLEALTQFPPEGVDEFADRVFELHRLGFLRGWSVGFQPLRWEPMEGGGIRFLEQELLEYSSVPVPANAEAVDLAVAKGLLKSDEARRFFSRPWADSPETKNMKKGDMLMNKTEKQSDNPRLGELAGEVEALSGRVDEHERRIGALEERLDEMPRESTSAPPRRKAAALMLAGGKGGSRFAETLRALRDGDAPRAKALGGQMDAAGGYLVPLEHLGELARVAERHGLLRRLGTRLPMASDSLAVPRLGSGVTASWVSEGQTAPETEPVFENVVLAAREARFRTVVSNALLEDADPRVGDILTALFGEAIARAEDEQAFAGTGAPFTGLLSAPGVAQLDKAGAALDLDDLIDLEMGIPAGAREDAAYFVPSLLLQQFKRFKDSAGQPLWMPAAGEQPQTINGYPVFVTETIPVAGGQTSIVFGNLRYLYLGERSPFAVKASEHVRFESDQTVFVGRERVAIAVVVPEAFARGVNVGVGA
jgi:HK97 family phage major capsid protein/HK97 family phage prohead protease